MNDSDTTTARVAAIEEASEAILSVLTEDYPADIWGAALGAVVSSLLESKRDAQEIAEEERARRELK